MRLAICTSILHFVTGSDSQHPNVGATGQFREIPEKGRYFYIDYTQGSQEGLYYSTIEVGESKQQVQLWASTNQSSVGIMTDMCHECGVADDKKFRHEALDGKPLLLSFYSTNPTDIYDGKELKEVRFTGEIYAEDIWLEYEADKFGKTRINFLAINQASQSFSSIYDGYLGLAPFTANIKQKDFNFLYQLKYTLKVIDYMSFSIYTKPDDPTVSTIKFGGYDKGGLKENTALTVLRTISEQTWAVKGQYFYLGSRTMKTYGDKRFVLFEPQLPYLYIPSTDFISFLEIMSREYSALRFHCVNRQGVCYTKNSCGNVKNIVRDNGYNMNIKIKIYDSVNSVYTVDIDGDSMWVDGNLIGLTANTDELCAFAIFQSDGLDQEHWFIGNQFLKEQYVVYDMTPYVEGKESYLNFGIGPKNAANYKPDYSEQTVVVEPLKPYNPERNETTGGEDKPPIVDPPVNPDPSGDDDDRPSGNPGEKDSSDGKNPNGEPDEGGSGGIIAFILFLLAAAAGGGFYYYRKKKLEKEA